MKAASLQSTEDIHGLLSAVFRRVPEHRLVAAPVFGQTAGGWSPSCRLELQSPAATTVLVCKAVAALHPKQAYQQRLCLQDWLAHHEAPGAYGVLLAPFVSEASRAALAAHGVGSLDAAGNVFVQVQGLHIERTVPGNPLRQERQLRSFFTPKAGHILRELLLQPCEWKGTDLAQAAGVSMGYVSGVRSALVEQHWAASTRAGLQVTQPLKVLQAWAQARPQDVAPVAAYTVLHGKSLEDRLRDVCEQGRGRALLAGNTCAQRLAPFVRGGVTDLLVDAEGREVARRVLGLQDATATSGNVRLWQTDEGAYFRHAQQLPGGYLGTDLVTTYLIMHRQGERMREGAEHLLRECLQPLWAAAHLVQAAPLDA